VTVQISGVCERDIDLLLVEELVASPQFVKHFLGEAHALADGLAVDVAHSVFTALGESDVEITVEAGGARHRILIENKVDAPFQPRQAERYGKRARALEGTYRSVLTILVAPEDYLKHAKTDHPFDLYVALETLASWFTQGRHGTRAEYKRALIENAIERQKAGWTRVPDELCTAFYGSYWDLASRVAPALRMPKPEPRPAGSTWFTFKPHELPQGLLLVHKLPSGWVDLQFTGQRERMADLTERYGAMLDPDMFIREAGGSAAIRITVDRCDVLEPFEASKLVVEASLDAATRLLGMYMRSPTIDTSAPSAMESR
jgi:hypothetical protein